MPRPSLGLVLHKLLPTVFSQFGRLSREVLGVQAGGRHKGTSPSDSRRVRPTCLMGRAVLIVVPGYHGGYVCGAIVVAGGLSS